MIYVVAGTVCVLLMAALCTWLYDRYQVRLAQEYLTGFRDGQMAEAQANHASRPQRVQVPLSGRN